MKSPCIASSMAIMLRMTVVSATRLKFPNVLSILTDRDSDSAASHADQLPDVVSVLPNKVSESASSHLDNFPNLSSILQNKGADSAASHTDMIRRVLPGLGWGISSATDEYTTQLCFDGAAKMQSVLATEGEQMLQRKDLTYKTNSELKFALEHIVNGSRLAGNALQAAAKSLLGHTSGELKHGFELWHSQYYVPTVRYTITDPAVECQTSPISALTQMANQGQLDSGGVDAFLKVHGTHFVHSVVLGGKLELFHLRQSDGARVDIMSKQSVSMLSSSIHMTILGGHWDAPVRNSSWDTLQKAVNRWLQTVQDGQHLAVLSQHTTPIHMLLPHKLHKRMQAHMATVGHWYRRRSALRESLSLFGNEIQKKRADYSLAGSSIHARHGKIKYLTSILELVPQYCENCNEHNTFYNSGFAGMHSVSPASCKSTCIDHVLWVCKVALPQMELNKREDDAIVLVTAIPNMGKASLVEGINAAREFCNPQTFLSKPQGTPHGLRSSSLLQASLWSPDLVSANTTHARHHSSKVGWAVLPVSNVYTLPLCRDKSGHLQGMVMTSSKEPLQPTVHSYSSDLELKLAGIADKLVDPAVGAALKALLAQSDGRLVEGFQLVHVMYYVPMSVNALSDPSSACRQEHIAELQRKFDAGELDDDDIYNFLLLHGTRLANSVALGGRLDLFHVQKTGEMDLSFMSQDVSSGTTLSEMSINLNVLGGKWTQGSSVPTLQEAVEQWVTSVQTAVDLSVLTHTTMPISALFPSRMQPRIEEQVKHVTAGWMYSISVFETAQFLRNLLQKTKRKFEDAWGKNVQIEALREVLRSLGELCDIADEYVRLYDHGFVGMSGESSRPASFTQFCQRMMLWTCNVAAPKVTERHDILQTIIGIAPYAYVKEEVLETAAELCARSEHLP